MELRAVVRPMAKLLFPAAASPAAGKPSLCPIRCHSTTARDKRALKIAPHDSFLPDRRPGAVPSPDCIIYNPPSSEASPEHTPFLFLPRGDPRRTVLLRLQHAAATGTGGGPAPPSPATASSPFSSSSADELPPSMNPRSLKTYHRNPQGHVTQEQIVEMKRLRQEDPLQWSTARLASKFACSPVFVSIAAPAPKEHIKWLEEKLERKKQRWGHLKRQARDDRRKRAEMMYRGEI